MTDTEIAGIEYQHTKTGLISRLYNWQKQHHKLKGLPPLDYTRLQFAAWFWSQEESHNFYKEWAEHDFATFFRPHVGRKDCCIGYSLSNIYLARNLDYVNHRNEILSEAARGSRAVKGTSEITGEVIEFKSAAAAARFFDSPKGASNISRAARGKLKTAYGFSWEYAE